MFIVLSVIMAEPFWEFTRFMRWMQAEHRTAAKLADLGCESACRLLYRLHYPLPFISTIVNPKADTLN